MADPFIAEIRILPYTFAPAQWAWCDGQILPIAQNTTLYSLLGTTFGGNGRTTFALPNLKGRVPIHAGRSPGLTLKQYGSYSGAPVMPLTESNLPSHTHTAQAVRTPSDSDNPEGKMPALDAKNKIYKDNPDSTSQMAPQALSMAGGQGQDHENRQPWLVTPFCISLDGFYPSRN